MGVHLLLNKHQGVIDIDTFNAQDYFLFYDLMSKAQGGLISLDSDEDTEVNDLVYELLDTGYAESQESLSGNIDSVFLTTSGEAFLGKVRRWVKRDGRKGKVQLKVFEDARKNNGITLEKLLETEIDGQAISAAEIHEALDELEKYDAIIIPQGARGVREYRLPFRVRIRQGWITRMENQEPPAWSNLNSRIGSTYNTVDNSQHNTANISGNSQTFKHHSGITRSKTKRTTPSTQTSREKSKTTSLTYESYFKKRGWNKHSLQHLRKKLEMLRLRS